MFGYTHTHIHAHGRAHHNLAAIDLTVEIELRNTLTCSLMAAPLALTVAALL